MHTTANHIIQKLQQDILSLQGFKSLPENRKLITGLGKLEASFPQGVFPVGSVHEFIYADKEAGAATSGFASGLLSSLMRNSGGSCVWISASRSIFPPALKAFGLEPDRIIFIDLQNEKQLCWVMEEALKCNGLAAVVGELPQLSFTASRRLQLAVEKSRVTGMVLRKHATVVNTTACVSRWKITSMPSQFEGGLQVVGFPRWKVELLKIRNGRPGVWHMEWAAGRFRHIPVAVAALQPQIQRKAG